MGEHLIVGFAYSDTMSEEQYLKNIIESMRKIEKKDTKAMKIPIAIDLKGNPYNPFYSVPSGVGELIWKCGGCDIGNMGMTKLMDGTPTKYWNKEHGVYGHLALYGYKELWNLANSSYPTNTKLRQGYRIFFSKQKPALEDLAPILDILIVLDDAPAAIRTMETIRKHTKQIDIIHPTDLTPEGEIKNSLLLVGFVYSTNLNKQNSKHYRENIEKAMELIETRVRVGYPWLAQKTKIGIPVVKGEKLHDAWRFGTFEALRPTKTMPHLIHEESTDNRCWNLRSGESDNMLVDIYNVHKKHKKFLNRLSSDLDLLVDNLSILVVLDDESAAKERMDEVLEHAKKKGKQITVITPKNLQKGGSIEWKLPKKK